MAEKIHFVTVLFLPEEYRDNDKEVPKGWDSHLYKRKRCWGYFRDYEKAKKAILENWTDIYEVGYYNLALIESIEEGFLVHPLETWFDVKPIINPEFSAYTAAFGYGPAEGPIQSEGFYINDYKITEIEKPKRLGKVIGWSYG